MSVVSLVKVSLDPEMVLYYLYSRTHDNGVLGFKFLQIGTAKRKKATGLKERQGSVQKRRTNTQDVIQNSKGMKIYMR